MPSIADCTKAAMLTGSTTRDQRSRFEGTLTVCVQNDQDLQCYEVGFLSASLASASDVEQEDAEESRETVVYWGA